MAGLRKRFRWVALALVALAVGVATLFPAQAAAALKLPLLAVYSVSRMVAAYLLALVFAVAYGTTAATNKRAAVVMLPLLDVLQSIPILGFFPAALVFFVSTFQGSPVGLEVAVVFLIFTSMAWNMAFGVYESLSTIPHDLEDAAASFGVREWLGARTRPILDKYDRASARLDRVYKGHATAMRAVRRLDLVLFIAVFVLVVGAGLLGLAGLFLRP